MLTAMTANEANAAVFANRSRWPTGSDGFTRISVCLDPNSSTTQKADGAAGGLIHDRNPNLNEVVTRVRAALAQSWERWGSVRFVDWRMCDAITTGTSGYVKIFIHPNADNSSPVGIAARGNITSFKPWGNDFNRCISYNAATTHVEYRYDCVEQYAIHELGHVLGFRHEWSHPQAPFSCPVREPIGAGTFSSTFNQSFVSTVVNPQYDWDSIMTYTSGCVHQTGVRFGSTRLSPADIIAVSAVYPPPTGLQADVCNPGWFEAKRWTCPTNRSLAVGNTCSAGWIECIPGCNSGMFANDYWTCPGQPYRLVGQTCSTGWRTCGQ